MMDPARNKGETDDKSGLTINENMAVSTVSMNTTSTASPFQQHPPPSPLSGCYLLVVLPEPHTAQHKDLILNRLAKGFLSWDKDSCHVDLTKELQALVAQSPEGEEARNGERLIQYATENLVTEILIHPQTNTLLQCIRNLLASFTKHRHIIHAGYTFNENGSWILQDGTFSLADFLDAFNEHDVQRVLRAYENSITVDINCAGIGDWSGPRLLKEPGTRSCRIRLNPDDVLTAGMPAITSFTNYISQYLIGQTLDELMRPSDVVGNIRFSHPTLYVFPGGQGDAALFGINGFNMLVDGGFARKSCFWDFTRHLDRLDAVLFTRLNNSNVGGMSSVLRKKKQMHVYPQIGHFFCNLIERNYSNSPDGDKDLDPLVLSLMDLGQEMMINLRQINLRPHSCYRDHEPINLYHKVGHGTLDMYVLSPTKDSREVREFLSKWNATDWKLFAGSHKKDANNMVFPIQNLTSICALLVWQPANPDDTITRILFPGSTPQHKIFEGLQRLNHLEFLKHPTCNAKSISPSASLISLKEKSMKQKIIAADKEVKRAVEVKKQKRETVDVKKTESVPQQQPQPIIIRTKKMSALENKKLDEGKDNSKVIDTKKTEKIVKETKKEVKKEVSKIDKEGEIKKSDTVKTKVDVEKIGVSKVSKNKIERKKKEVKEPTKPTTKTPKTDNTGDQTMKVSTPKKIVNGVTSKTEISKTQPSKVPSKPAAKTTLAPAKSAKDANNRKVLEQKNNEKMSMSGLITSTTKSKPKPAAPPPVQSEKKPVSRQIKPTTSPGKGRFTGSPIKSMKTPPAVKTEKDAVIRRIKAEKPADSSAVSTPSAIEIDAIKYVDKSLTEKSEDMSLDSIESKVLADLKEEREVVEEIEAVLQKAERNGGGAESTELKGETEDETTEANYKKEEDMTEDDVTADIDDVPRKELAVRKASQELTEEDEYLIIEKEEMDTDHSVQSRESERKHIIDATESEKDKFVESPAKKEMKDGQALDEEEEEEEEGEEEEGEEEGDEDEEHEEGEVEIEVDEEEDEDEKHTGDVDEEEYEKDDDEVEKDVEKGIFEEREKTDEPEKSKLAVSEEETEEKTRQKRDVSDVKYKEQLDQEMKGIISSATEIIEKIGKDESGKKDSEDVTKEPSSQTPEKLDSSEKKTTDTDIKPETDLKAPYPEKMEESQERISTIESGATTTAPTLPEDERISAEAVKPSSVEKMMVTEDVKRVETVGKAKVIPLTTEAVEAKSDAKIFVTRQPIQALPRESVKTPDEVADLPVHEEVDPKLYEVDQFSKTKEEKIEPKDSKEQKGVFGFFGKVADKFERGMDKLTGKGRRDSEKDIDEKSSSKSASPKETTDIISKMPDIKPKKEIESAIQEIKKEAEIIHEDLKKSAGEIEMGISEDVEEVEALLEEASKKFRTVKDSLRDSLESLDEPIIEEEFQKVESAPAAGDEVKGTLDEVAEKLEEIKLSPGIDKLDSEDLEIEGPLKNVREAMRDVGEVLAGTAGIVIENVPKDVEEIVKKVAEVLKEDDLLAEKILFQEQSPKSDLKDSDKALEHLETECHEEPCIKHEVKKAPGVMSPKKEKASDKSEAKIICSDLMKETEPIIKMEKTSAEVTSPVGKDVMEIGIEHICEKVDVHHVHEDDKAEQIGIQASEIILEQKSQPATAELVIVSPDSVPPSPKFPGEKLQDKVKVEDTKDQTEIVDVPANVAALINNTDNIHEIIEKLILVDKVKITIIIFEYIIKVKHITRDKVVEIINQIILHNKIVAADVIADPEILNMEKEVPDDKELEIEEYINDQYVKRTIKITRSILEDISVKKSAPLRIIIQIIQEIIFKKKIPMDKILDISEDEIHKILEDEEEEEEEKDVDTKTKEIIEEIIMKKKLSMQNIVDISESVWNDLKTSNSMETGAEEAINLDGDNLIHGFVSIQPEDIPQKDKLTEISKEKERTVTDDFEAVEQEYKLEKSDEYKARSDAEEAVEDDIDDVVEADEKMMTQSLDKTMSPKEITLTDKSMKVHEKSIVRDEKPDDTKLTESEKSILDSKEKTVDSHDSKPEETIRKDDEKKPTVQRMMVTATSEDGGGETEICPTGSITFGKTSPDDSSGTSPLKAKDEDLKQSRETTPEVESEGKSLVDKDEKLESSVDETIIDKGVGVDVKDQATADDKAQIQEKLAATSQSELSSSVESLVQVSPLSHSLTETKELSPNISTGTVDKIITEQTSKDHDDDDQITKKEKEASESSSVSAERQNEINVEIDHPVSSKVPSITQDKEASEEKTEAAIDSHSKVVSTDKIELEKKLPTSDIESTETTAVSYKDKDDSIIRKESLTQANEIEVSDKLSQKSSPSEDVKPSTPPKSIPVALTQTSDELKITSPIEKDLSAVSPSSRSEKDDSIASLHSPSLIKEDISTDGTTKDMKDKDEKKDESSQPISTEAKTTSLPSSVQDDNLDEEKQVDKKSPESNIKDIDAIVPSSITSIEGKSVDEKSDSFIIDQDKTPISQVGLVDKEKSPDTSKKIDDIDIKKEITDAKLTSTSVDESKSPVLLSSQSPEDTTVDKEGKASPTHELESAVAKDTDDVKKIGKIDKSLSLSPEQKKSPALSLALSLSPEKKIGEKDKSPSPVHDKTSRASSLVSESLSLHASEVPDKEKSPATARDSRSPSPGKTEDSKDKKIIDTKVISDSVEHKSPTPSPVSKSPSHEKDVSLEKEKSPSPTRKMSSPIISKEDEKKMETKIEQKSSPAQELSSPSKVDDRVNKKIDEKSVPSKELSSPSKLDDKMDKKIEEKSSPAQELSSPSKVDDKTDKKTDEKSSPVHELSSSILSKADEKKIDEKIDEKSSPPHELSSSISSKVDDKMDKKIEEKSSPLHEMPSSIPSKVDDKLEKKIDEKSSPAHELSSPISSKVDDKMDKKIDEKSSPAQELSSPSKVDDKTDKKIDEKLSPAQELSSPVSSKVDEKMDKKIDEKSALTQESSSSVPSELDKKIAEKSVSPSPEQKKSPLPSPTALSPTPEKLTLSEKDKSPSPTHELSSSVSNKTDDTEISKKIDDDKTITKSLDLTESTKSSPETSVSHGKEQSSPSRELSSPVSRKSSVKEVDEEKLHGKSPPPSPSSKKIEETDVEKKILDTKSISSTPEQEKSPEGSSITQSPIHEKSPVGEKEKSPNKIQEFSSSLDKIDHTKIDTELIDEKPIRSDITDESTVLSPITPSKDRKESITSEKDKSSSPSKDRKESITSEKDKSPSPSKDRKESIISEKDKSPSPIGQLSSPSKDRKESIASEKDKSPSPSKDRKESITSEKDKSPSPIGQLSSPSKDRKESIISEKDKSPSPIEQLSTPARSKTGSIEMDKGPIDEKSISPSADQVKSGVSSPTIPSADRKKRDISEEEKLASAVGHLDSSISSKVDSAEVHKEIKDETVASPRIVPSELPVSSFVPQLPTSKMDIVDKEKLSDVPRDLHSPSTKVESVEIEKDVSDAKSVEHSPEHKSPEVSPVSQSVVHDKTDIGKDKVSSPISKIDDAEKSVVTDKHSVEPKVSSPVSLSPSHEKKTLLSPTHDLSSSISSKIEEKSRPTHDLIGSMSSKVDEKLGPAHELSSPVSSKVDDKTDKKIDDKSSPAQELSGPSKVDEKMDKKIDDKSSPAQELSSASKLDDKTDKKIDDKSSPAQELSGPSKVDEKMDKKIDDKSSPAQELSSASKLDDKTDKKIDEKSSPAQKLSGPSKVDEKMDKKIDDKSSPAQELSSPSKLDDKTDKKIDEKSSPPHELSTPIPTKLAEEKIDKKIDDKSISPSPEQKKSPTPSPVAQSPTPDKLISEKDKSPSPTHMSTKSSPDKTEHTEIDKQIIHEESTAHDTKEVKSVSPLPPHSPSAEKNITEKEKSPSHHVVSPTPSKTEKTELDKLILDKTSTSLSTDTKVSPAPSSKSPSPSRKESITSKIDESQSPIHESYSSTPSKTDDMKEQMIIDKKSDSLTDQHKSPSPSLPSQSSSRKQSLISQKDELPSQISIPPTQDKDTKKDESPGLKISPSRSPVAASPDRKQSLTTSKKDESDLKSTTPSESEKDLHPSTSSSRKISTDSTDAKPIDFTSAEDKKNIEDYVAELKRDSVKDKDVPSRDRSRSHSLFETGDRTPLGRSRAASLFEDKEEIAVSMSKISEQPDKKPSQIPEGHSDQRKTSTELSDHFDGAHAKRIDIEHYVMSQYIKRKQNITIDTLEEIATLYDVPESIVIEIIQEICSRENIDERTVLIYQEIDSSGSKYEPTDDNKSRISSVKRREIEDYITELYIKPKKKLSAKIISEVAALKGVPIDIVLTMIQYIIIENNIPKESLIDDELCSMIGEAEEEDEEIDFRETLDDTKMEIETYVMENCIERGNAISLSVLNHMEKLMSVPQNIILDIIIKYVKRMELPLTVYDDVIYSKITHGQQTVGHRSGKSTPERKSSGYSTPEVKDYGDKYESQFHKAFVDGMTEIRTTHITTLSGKSTPDVSAHDHPDSLTELPTTTGVTSTSGSGSVSVKRTVLVTDSPEHEKIITKTIIEGEILEEYDDSVKINQGEKITDVKSIQGDKIDESSDQYKLKKMTPVPRHDYTGQLMSENKSGRSTPEIIKTTIITTRTVSQEGEIITTTKEVTETTNEKGETTMTEKVDVTRAVESGSSAIDSIKEEADQRSVTPSSEISPHKSVSRQTILSSGVEERQESDDEAVDSPMSVTSQVYRYEKHEEPVKFTAADMSSSFYGELPAVPPTRISGIDVDKDKSDDFSFKKVMMDKPTDASSSKKITEDESVDKILKEKYAKDPHDDDDDDDTHGAGKISKDPLREWGSPLKLPPPERPEKFNLRTGAIVRTVDISPDSLDVDVIHDWGEPLRLPSPTQIGANDTTNKITPTAIKKDVKQSRKVISENIKNKKGSESPIKTEKKSRESKNKVQPVYLDLTYVPHHGNSYYASLEFFKRVRARYYVFSGTEPSREVFDALLSAKKTWENKNLEVTIIPTYDTDTLGYWVADNEEALAANHIDLSPSASRCTINLQDHETSCSAYRLEF